MTRATQPFSARFDRRLLERLDASARAAGRSRSSLAERYVEEGMRMDEHPGIVFRDGPSGRRAGLLAGPDVAEVMTVVKNAPEPDERVEHAAEWLDLTPDQVLCAVGYYGEFPDEIDERIKRNRELGDAAEAAWRRQHEALG
jgi:hypothetical protein